MADYLAKAIRDSLYPVHRYNATYCLSKISFNESSLDKLIDVAEDIRSQFMQDEKFETYFKEKVMKTINTIPFQKEEVKERIETLQTKLYGSEADLMRVKSNK